MITLSNYKEYEETSDYLMGSLIKVMAGGVERLTVYGKDVTCVATLKPVSVEQSRKTGMHLLKISVSLHSFPNEQGRVERLTFAAAANASDTNSLLPMGTMIIEGVEKVLDQEVYFRPCKISPHTTVKVSFVEEFTKSLDDNALKLLLETKFKLGINYDPDGKSTGVP
jgi:hypothetical protein